MVGSGGAGDSRSNEVVGMMALHEALRNLCLNSDWNYSVFWTIRPRPRCRGGNACRVGDDNGSLMLMWEDGFCRSNCLEDMDGDDQLRKAFSKMSIQLYNYGEGLMGKVASDRCHKWVFKESSEFEPNISNYWQSSFDAIPPEWTEQFASGIQTIAVIQVGHGLLQLGSCKNIPEDLRFVLSIRQAFAFLGYQSGFYLSQLFSSSSDSNSPSPFSVTSPVGEPRYKQALPRPPPLLYNWNHQQSLGIITYGGGFNPADHIAALHGGSKDDGQTLLPMQHPSSGAPVNDMIADHDPDVKWPNGLSFTSTIGRVDDSKLRFGGGGGVEEESSKSISEDQGIDKQI